MNSDKTITLTNTGNGNWSEVVGKSLRLSPAPNGNSSQTIDLVTKQNKRALDYRFIIASGSTGDIDFSSPDTISYVQRGLKSVSDFIGDREYTVVDTQTLSKANSWKYKWGKKPKYLYEEDGSIYKLTYYVIETSAIGASTNSYEGQGTEINVTLPL